MFNPSDYHPKFVAAMEALGRIPESQRRNNAAASSLFEQAFLYAPDHLQKMFRDKAIELGILPEHADFYSEDGEPLYSTAQVAQHLGISLEEANRQARKLSEDHPDMAFTSDTKTIYRRQ